MERRITGFATDDEGHWVAELECGHRQHMRHRPPFESRPWVTTPEGRESRIGVTVNCRRCEPPEGAQPGPLDPDVA
jgi:hypothetical protein